MEISLFQILILLFLLYPLLKRIFGVKPEEHEDVERADPSTDPWSRDQDYGQSQSKNQPYDTGASSRQPSPSEQPTYGTTSRTDPGNRNKETGEKSWEDFFEGLEDVLAGKESGGDSRSGTTMDQSTHHRTETSQQSPSSHSGSRSSEAYRHPSHGPVFGGKSGTAGSTGSVYRTAGSSGSGTSSSAASKNSYQHDSNTSSGLGDQVSRELIATENPIYTDIEDAPEVTIIGKSGTKNVKRILSSPENLRDGIMLKVILDPPVSRRPHPQRY